MTNSVTGTQGDHYVKLARYIPPDGQKRRILKWDIFARYRGWSDLWSCSELSLDLDGVDVLGHDGLIWVCFICLYRQSRSLSTKVLIPDDPDAIQWLMALGFSRLRHALGFTIPNEYLIPIEQVKYIFRDKSPWSLRRLQFIDANSWPTVVGFAPQYVTAILEEYFGTGLSDETRFERIQPFSLTVAELINNIALHGGNEAGRGVGIAAYTPWPRGNPRIRFCCSDIGPGIVATINNKNGESCDTEKDALVKALLFRYFNTDDRIIGLYPTLAFIRKQQGRLAIRTGKLLATLDLASARSCQLFDSHYSQPTGQWMKNLISFETGENIPGTHVCVDLMLPRIRRRQQA